MSEREMLSWELFGLAARQLVDDVVEDGFMPDLILAIARGGLFLAGALGYGLDVKNIHLTNVEYYTGVDERLDAPVMLPPLPDVAELGGTRMLIADDVADTGATLRFVRDYCAEHVAEVRCAVVYQKAISDIDCEYVWRRTDRWIDFPWSS
jgi:hypoxanthine phosphoribosyltransferase